MTRHRSFSSSFVISTIIFVTALSCSLGNLYLESSALFRSNALKFHDSFDHFLKASEAFRTTSATVINTYLVRIPAGCDYACHKKLIRRFGRDRYDIISAEIGMVTTSLAELQNFYEDTFPINQFSQASEKRGLRFDYAPFHPEMKIDSEFRPWMQLETCHSKMTSSLRILFMAHGLTKDEYIALDTALEGFLLEHTGLERVMGFKDGKFEEMKRFHGVITVKECSMVADVVQFLTNRPEIHWLERKHPIELQNFWAEGVCDTGRSDSWLFSPMGISGEGEVIGISDSGLDMNHCEFHDVYHSPPFNIVNPNHRKVVTYLTYSDDVDGIAGHGTYVAGTAAGYAGPLDQDYGMAPEAKIAFADLGSKENPNDIFTPDEGIYTMFERFHEAGANIMSNSWGSPIGYAFDSYQVDTFMWDYPDSVVFFAAGNYGNNDTSYTILNPANSKSVVTVGSALNDHYAWETYLATTDLDPLFGVDTMSWFSSRGPTSDGRLKPDILAPGDRIYSALSSDSTRIHCDFYWSSGTSMATPAAAGTAAKVREYFRKGFYPSGVANIAHGFIPSGALIKATLIHSGQEVHHVLDTLQKYDKEGYRSFSFVNKSITYPSIFQGYGRIQLNTVFDDFPFSIQKRFVVGGATANDSHYAVLESTGAYRTYTFRTSNVSSPLPIRVTFVYTDAPGSYVAAVPTQNHLNISVLTESEVFIPYLPNSTDDYQIVKSSVQVIDIPSPTPNTTYIVKIMAEQILEGPQPIAMVMTGDITHVSSYWSEDPAVVLTSMSPSSSPVTEPTKSPVMGPANSNSNQNDNDNVTGTNLPLDMLLVAVIVPIGVVLLAVVVGVLYWFISSSSSSYSQANTQEVANVSKTGSASAPAPAMTAGGELALVPVNNTEVNEEVI